MEVDQAAILFAMKTCDEDCRPSHDSICDEDAQAALRPRPLL
ncbi:unnamed protein product [Cuscuta europaea]|uniref:Uncharacterized protein n=1 Tax=Cuscuta europaea TaxID=41803 RepID=A0A9P1DWN4_CUSEU|nr:unnamed protein product [Cuscuta europaea]